MLLSTARPVHRRQAWETPRIFLTYIQSWAVTTLPAAELLTYPGSPFGACSSARRTRVSPATRTSRLFSGWARRTLISSSSTAHGGALGSGWKP